MLLTLTNVAVVGAYMLQPGDDDDDDGDTDARQVRQRPIHIFTQYTQLMPG